jgi:hypothetical protein
VINQQTIIDKARLLLGIQFTARSYSDLDGVYSHERVIKSADFLISEISNRDKRIAELEKTEPLLQKVLDCCDGLHCEYTQANYGDAKNWLRHISDAYADYQDSIDLIKGGAE